MARTIVTLMLFAPTHQAAFLVRAKQDTQELGYLATTWTSAHWIQITARNTLNAITLSVRLLARASPAILAMALSVKISMNARKERMFASRAEIVQIQMEDILVGALQGIQEMALFATISTNVLWGRTIVRIQRLAPTLWDPTHALAMPDLQEMALLVKILTNVPLELIIALTLPRVPILPEVSLVPVTADSLAMALLVQTSMSVLLEQTTAT